MSFNELIIEAQELVKHGASFDTLVQKQIMLEEQADSLERELREGKRLKDLFTSPTSDPKVIHIISAVFDKMAESFQNAMDTVTRGPGAKYRYILRALPVDVLVATSLTIAFRRLVHRDSVDNTVQRTGTALGRAIVTEVKVSQAYKLNPFYMQCVTRRLESRSASNTRFIGEVYNAAFDTVTMGKLKYDLNSADYLQIGKFALQAMLESGLIEASFLPNGHGRPWNIYNLNQEVYDYIMESTPDDTFKRVISSSFKFMIVPPDPWESIGGGGFKSARRKMSNNLIRLKHLTRKNYRRYEENMSLETSTPVYRFVNRIQDVAFKIDQDSLDLIYKVMEAGGGMFSVPNLRNPEPPPFPFAEDWDKKVAPEDELDVFSAWKYSMTLWHTEMKAIKSKRREIASFTQAVNQGFDKLYFPVFLDFRGRMYYNGHPNPQGSDIARATLAFYEGKPLGERGLYWLKVHLANNLGYDSTRFDDRVAYVESIWESIEKALVDPIAHCDAFGDENPLSAYAVALDIKRALDSGDPASYVSHIPVHMDATVSGTQHFSALLRDEVGAEYTNLIDLGGDRKADMYTRVANVALEKMMQETREEYLESARKWIARGIPRDLAKRPVMTYTYGVTRVNVMDLVKTHLRENGASYTASGFDSRDVVYITNILFEAIAETIPATVQGMEFLQQVARENGPNELCWRTPSGFWVWFDSKVQKSTRIPVRSAGVDLVQLRVHTDETNRGKQISGISPNFIHSMDASHLCFLSNRMLDEGKDLVCIHDSIGTHANDVDVLHKHIRESFVEMYSSDVLEDFKQQIGSQVDLPVYGNFDLNNVLESEFFFC